MAGEAGEGEVVAIHAPDLIAPYHRRPMRAFTTADELADAARAALPAELWDYVTGGGGTEATLRRNRAALDALLLRPRVGRDVSVRRTSTTLLGAELALPVMLAPIGTIGLFDAGGAASAARAAARAGTASFVSLLSVPDLEDGRGDRARRCSSSTTRAATAAGRSR